jgi:hypothetical protein
LAICTNSKQQLGILGIFTDNQNNGLPCPMVFKNSLYAFDPRSLIADNSHAMFLKRLSTQHNRPTLFIFLALA